jgi:hypothetical protein
MVAIKPWHLSVLACVVLVATIAVVAVFAASSSRRK